MLLMFTFLSATNSANGWILNGVYDFCTKLMRNDGDTLKWSDRIEKNEFSMNRHKEDRTRPSNHEQMEISASMKERI